MTTITNTYNLTSIKQLIDLNGDKVNFELQFKIDAKNGETFDALVVTQEIIDSGAELTYQKAEGSIGGNIVSDKGQYQNYLLLLKADKPTEVNVIIQIKDLPPPAPAQPSVPENFQHQPHPHPYHQQQPYPYQQQPYPQQQPIKSKNKKINWLNVIFIVIGLILLGFVGWMFYKYYTKPQIQPQPQPQPIIQQINPEIDTSKITTEISKIVDGKINEIDNKLNDKLSVLESGINVSSDKLNSFGDNFSSLHEQFKNIDGKVSEAIVQNTGIFDKVVDKVSDNNKGLFNEVLEKNTGMFNQVMEKQSNLVSEAIETTLNKASTKLDLSSVQSQLNDISSKLERDTVSQLSNPIPMTSSKSSKKESLSSQIKKLKISST
jgi:hypothetical protein